MLLFFRSSHVEIHNTHWWCIFVGVLESRVISLAYFSTHLAWPMAVKCTDLSK